MAIAHTSQKAMATRGRTAVVAGARPKAGAAAPKARTRSPSKTPGSRSTTAYTLFTKAEFPSFKTRFPDLKVSDIQKLISYKWSKVPQHEKDEWAVRARSAAPADAAPAVAKGKSSRTVKAASASKKGSVATLSTLSEAEEKAGLQLFTTYELPNYQTQYADLDKADHERLISFKWSKLDGAEKEAWANKAKYGGAAPAASSSSSSSSRTSFSSSSESAGFFPVTNPVRIEAPVETKKAEAGYSAFAKAELAKKQAEYPDLDKADLEKLVSFAWTKLPSREKTAWARKGSPVLFENEPVRKAAAPSYSSSSSSSSSASSKSDAGYAAFAKAELPNKKAKYPDLDDSDLERLISFKWSKLTQAEKNGWGNGSITTSSYSTPVTSSYSAPTAASTSNYNSAASAKPTDAGYAAFLKAELPAFKAQYPDLGDADLEKLVSFKWSKKSTGSKAVVSPKKNVRPAATAAPAPSRSSSAVKAAAPAPKPAAKPASSGSSDAGYAAFYAAELAAKKKEYPDLAESDLAPMISYKWSKVTAAEKSSYKPSASSAPVSSRSAPAKKAVAKKSSSSSSYSAPASSANLDVAWAAFKKSETPRQQALYPDLDTADVDKLVSYQWSRLTEGEQEAWAIKAKYAGGDVFGVVYNTPSSKSDPAFAAFVKAELPNKKAKYPDLDEADLERLISFKWSKVPEAEKRTWASKGSSYSAPAAAAPVAAASSPKTDAGYAAFLKAELPGFKAQYPDLGDADLEKLVSFKWSKQGSKGVSSARPSSARPSSSRAPAAAAAPARSSAPATASNSDAGYAAFLAAELPAKKREYPDLDDSDLERLVSFKWSKVSSSEKSAWASKKGGVVASAPAPAPAARAPVKKGGRPTASRPAAAPAAPARSSNSGASGFDAFFERELPGFQAQYSDLDASDLKNLIQYKWNRLSDAEKSSYGGASRATSPAADFWGSSSSSSAAAEEDRGFSPLMVFGEDPKAESSSASDEAGWSPLAGLSSSSKSAW